VNTLSGYQTDTPADALQADNSFYWRQDNFECYLMFKPNGGKLVPLKLATWNWYGRAQRDNTNSPPLFHGVPPFTNPLAAVGTDCVSHPIWTNNIVNLENNNWEYNSFQYPTP